VGAFVTSFDADVSELPELRHRLADWLEAQDVEQQTAFTVRLLAHEVAQNAHAEPGDSVEVRAAIEPDCIMLEVTAAGANDWDLEPGDGAEIRGLTLIHTLAERLEVIRRPEGTTLVMLVPFEPAGPGELDGDEPFAG
jgi:anti-sigma regulatory factor (Ser/Thr protein kinase)